MSIVPKLEHTVHVRGQAYLAGTVPPLEIARQITNRAAWGGELPNLDEAEDGEETAGPVPLTTLVSGGFGGDTAIPQNGDPHFEGPRTEGRSTDGGPGQSSAAVAAPAAPPKRTRRTSNQ